MHLCCCLCWAASIRWCTLRWPSMYASARLVPPAISPLRWAQFPNDGIQVDRLPSSWVLSRPKSTIRHFNCWVRESQARNRGSLGCSGSGPADRSRPSSRLFLPLNEVASRRQQCGDLGARKYVPRHVNIFVQGSWKYIRVQWG